MKELNTSCTVVDQWWDGGVRVRLAVSANLCVNDTLVMSSMPSPAHALFQFHDYGTLLRPCSDPCRHHR